MSKLQGALTGWVARVVANHEVNASVDGRWAKQSEDQGSNPLVMVSVLAHDPEVVLGPVAGSGEAVRTRRVAGTTGAVVRELSRPAASDHGRPVRGAGPCAGP